MITITHVNRKEASIALAVFIVSQILVRILYPIVGGEAASLSIVPSLLIAWFWGPWIGFAGALSVLSATLLNITSLGVKIENATGDLIGIGITLSLSIAAGYYSNIIKKNKLLNIDLIEKSDILTNALEEKNKTEKTLLDKIDFIRFSSKISSEFINIPPLLIESRIETAVNNIVKFVQADFCSIYILDEYDKSYVLFKEINGQNSTLPYRHYYKFKFDIISDLLETLFSDKFLVMDKRLWNHPLLEIFKAPSIIILPLVSDNKLIGIISFESFIEKKEWSKYFQDVFPLTEQIIAYAFERKFAEEKIRSQYEELKKNSESLISANQKLNDLNETLISTSAELAESEMKFRELSENLEDIIWLQQGRKVLYVNQAYEKIWGKNREDLYKRSTDFFNSLYGKEKEFAIKSFLSHDYEKQGDFKQEFRIIDGGGNIRWILARSFLISKENGKIKVAGIAEDITLRKQAEEDIKNALNKAIELNQLKSRFISTVSHELRTPLATILSSIELLRYYEESMNSEDKSILFTKIFASIDYLTSLLDDVITIDKSESGAILLNYEPTELVSLITEIIENIKLIKNVKTDIKLKTKIARLNVVIDKKLFSQIFGNLLTNAIKFSPADKSIEVSITANNGQFEIQVTDHGMGIPSEAQSNIFVPFFRAVNAQYIQGSGLGLSIAKRWTELLKGEISFESQTKKRTTFKIKFPINNSIIKSESGVEN